MIEKVNNMGTINISLDVVATVAGSAATECYGVVGMASQKVFKDGYHDLLRIENYSKGVVVKPGTTGLILDLYVMLGYGMKLTEVLQGVQKKVKYVVETTLDVDIESVNIYVQEVRVIE